MGLFSKRSKKEKESAKNIVSPDIDFDSLVEKARNSVQIEDLNTL
jgi:hypothetical protein